MPILTNTSDPSPARDRGSQPFVASIALMMAGFAPLSQASPPSAQSDQPTYLSAEDAVSALFHAVVSGNEPAVQKVLGADDQLISSADAAADERDRERFVAKYQQMHRLAWQSDGTQILYIGAENWPFPVPLVPSNGAWRFDAGAGAAEVLFRRIGENEISVVRACHSLDLSRQTPAADDEAADPPEVGTLVTTLLSGKESGNKTVPYHGYYFRIVSRSREGFTAVAYPAAYRSSGVMTFVVTANKAVYEKDLGPAGARTAQSMSKIRTDSTWMPVEDVTGP
jgi:hypothetical protein